MNDLGTDYPFRNVSLPWDTRVDNLVSLLTLEELQLQMARGGLEVRAKYNNYTRNKEYGDHKGLSCFSPVINIMRDPRWGRNQETYGEDPYLSGILATSFVRGLQGNDSRYILTNAGCKHFDVHGGPEDIPVSRFSFDAKEILRNELGFKGYVVSDQSALERLITDHHYVSSNVTAAVAALQAGVSLEVSKNNLGAVFMNIVLLTV
nr:hypothetical protein BaRGS_012828 [Batillaria attramentaria]